jgi:hypothetical protein
LPGPASGAAEGASVPAVAGYFDDVADELDRCGLTVDAVEIDARRPLSGRLVVAAWPAGTTPGGRLTVVLRWRQDTGWWGTQRGVPGRSTAGPAAAPREVVRILHELAGAGTPGPRPSGG